MRYDVRPFARARRRMRRLTSALPTIGACVLVLGTIALAGYAGVHGCAGDPKRVARVLKSAGYENADVGDADGFAGCRGTSNVFSAVSPAGTYVEGVVCCPSRLSCGSTCSIRFGGEDD